MAFGSLFGPKGKLALQAQDSCLPGELIPIGIQVTIANEIKPREVRAELVGEETFYVTETRHSGGHVSTQTVQKNEIFASLIETLAEQPSLYKGVEQKWGCFLGLPSEAPPTCRGKLVNIRWKLKAVLDVPKSRLFVKLCGNRHGMVQTPVASFSNRRPRFSGRMISALAS